MIRAVIFDMFDTLITHYRSPLYFGKQMAEDAGISEERFVTSWRKTEDERTLGIITLEEALEIVFVENQVHSKSLIEKIVAKRIESKEECFRNLHSEIIPMLSELKAKGILVGLISNCFSEEAKVIRESQLFSYFDAVVLSYEEGIQKPDEKIYYKCLEALSVEANECIYIGDGGSNELEAARKLGMLAVQATWYLQDGISQPSKKNPNFVQLANPLAVLEMDF